MTFKLDVDQPNPTGCDVHVLGSSQCGIAQHDMCLRSLMLLDEFDSDWDKQCMRMPFLECGRSMIHYYATNRQGGMSNVMRCCIQPVVHMH
jgi:hypothetical protein